MQSSNFSQQVFDDAQENYRSVDATATAVMDAALAALGTALGPSEPAGVSAGTTLHVLNLLSTARCELIALPTTTAVPTGCSVQAVSASANQPAALLAVAQAGSCGVQPLAATSTAPATALLLPNGSFVLQNQFVRAEFSSNGQLVALVQVRAVCKVKPYP